MESVLFYLLEIEDSITLSCNLANKYDSIQQCRAILAAVGFGSRLCHLEHWINTERLPNMSLCVFILEQAMSVRALQERVVATTSVTGSGSQAGRRTLLYGHAVLLRHTSSRKYLSCLSSCSTSDKLAFDVGLEQHSQDESCWWTIHPASHHRSEGEKVRLGDNVIFVNVYSERYLYVSTSSNDLTVQASFQQTVWIVNPVMSGWALTKSRGYLNGGDVMRFIRGGDEYLSIPDDYKCGSEEQHWWSSAFIRWGQPFRLRNVISGQYIGMSDDKKHLCLLTSEAAKSEDSALFCLQPSQDNICIWDEKDEINQGMGIPEIKFGDSLVFLRHYKTGLWVGPQTTHGQRKQVIKEPFPFNIIANKKSSDIKVHLLVEGHMDSALSVTRGETEEIRTAHIIKVCSELLYQFLSSLGTGNSDDNNELTIKHETEDVDLKALEYIVFILNDLLGYFAWQKENLAHEVKQKHRVALKKRQELFQNEGVISLVLDVIGKICRDGDSKITFQDVQNDSMWFKIHDLLFKLLAAMIRENHTNCTKLVEAISLDWLLKRLEREHYIDGLLQVLLCILTESSQSLSSVKEQHIKCMINLLDKHGRDNRILDMLSRICVCNGVAVRANQNLICDNLLPKQKLLLQTKLVDQITSVTANIYVGLFNGSAQHSKWYFEVAVDHVEPPSQDSVLCVANKAASPISHLRIGWRNIKEVHHAEAGENWSGAGIGDSIFSYGFDGVNLWTNGRYLSVKNKPVSKAKRTMKKSGSMFCFIGQEKLGLNHSLNIAKDDLDDSMESSSVADFDSEDNSYNDVDNELNQSIQEDKLNEEAAKTAPHQFRNGDVIGCYLDLGKQSMTFSINGKLITGEFRDISIDKQLFSPAISMSSTVRCRLLLGGDYGEFNYNSRHYAPIYEGLDYGESVRVQESMVLGNPYRYEIIGPTAQTEHSVFIPAPIDTTDVSLPTYLNDLRDKLAINMHDIWARNKIDAGWKFGRDRSDTLKVHPCLRPFTELSQEEKEYDIKMAMETLKSLVALGYVINVVGEGKNVTKYQHLPDSKYLLSNGYKPHPLDLAQKEILNDHLEKVVEILAKNAHEVWAKDRIQQGWSYGLSKDGDRKRNPMLIPYEKLDEQSMKSNRDTARETIRTIIGFGCTIDSPAVDLNVDSAKSLSRQVTDRAQNGSMRTFRVEKMYAVRRGKWYYEFHVNSPGMMRVGWCSEFFEAGKEVGGSSNSYSYDGFLARKWNHGSESFGKTWNKGDIVGCLLDLDTGKISFTLNGELLQDGMSSYAFEDIDVTVGYLPACSLAVGQSGRINFGHDPTSFKYFNIFGYQENYDPFGIVTSDSIPLWFASGIATFETINDTHPTVKVTEWLMHTRDHPTLRVNSKPLRNSSDQSHKKFDLLRLNYPVNFTVPMVSSSRRKKSKFLGKYCFTLRIFKAQDPYEIYVGWISSKLHNYGNSFGDYSSRKATMKGWKKQSDNSDDQLSSTNTATQVQKLHNALPSYWSDTTRECYMARVSDLIAERGKRKISSAVLGDILIDCYANVNTGKLDFAFNGSTCQFTHFDVEEGAKLYPAIYVRTPNNDKNLFQIEFRISKDCLPVCFTSNSHKLSQKSDATHLIKRPVLQALKANTWCRMQTSSLVTVEKALRHGYEIEREDPSYSVMINIPEENRCINLQELIEKEKLMYFHTHTLKLYSALCSHGNIYVADKIRYYVDEWQLMYCIQCFDLPDVVRVGYYDLLVSLHLEEHAKARLLTRGEYILPLKVEKATPISFTSSKSDNTTVSNGSYSLSAAPLPGTVLSPHRKSGLTHDVSCTIEGAQAQSYSIQHTSLDKPLFPLTPLKKHVFRTLQYHMQAINRSRKETHRESRSLLLVPLLKVADCLLVMGVLDESDMELLLLLLDPQNFGSKMTVSQATLEVGLLRMTDLDEPVKLELCQLLDHLCDCQLRYRVESLVAYTSNFVDALQKEQRRRHNEIRNSQYPVAVTARKTREFRIPPRTQLLMLLSFKTRETAESNPCSKDLQVSLRSYHKDVLKHCGKGNGIIKTTESVAVIDRLKKSLWSSSKSTKNLQLTNANRATLQEILAEVLIAWGKQSITDVALIKAIFRLWFRLHDGMAELAEAITKTYTINDVGGDNVTNLLKALGSVRSLLTVRMGATEEMQMTNGLKELMNNTIFFQHPDLMRVLGVHKTVMEVMVNVLGKEVEKQKGSQFQSWAGATMDLSASTSPKPDGQSEITRKCLSPVMVAACCKFLCFFCRTSQQNQRAMFEHMTYLLSHSDTSVTCTSMVGATPLDVAAAAMKDNLELVLALRKHHLERVVSLLALTAPSTKIQSISDAVDMLTSGSTKARSSSLLNRSNTWSNRMLRARRNRIISKLEMMFDAGWEPKEGERYLDFLRHAIWVDNESVEENASLVVRLLIRRPECLGPALGSEGMGICQAFREAISLSLSTDDSATVNGKSRSEVGTQTLSFYSNLIDLAAKCSSANPIDSYVPSDIRVKAIAGTDHRKVALKTRDRIKAILQSLIPLREIIGVLSLEFSLPVPNKDKNCMELETRGLIPSHKIAMVTFLDRVYGVDSQEVLLRLLNYAFLPDLTNSISLDEVPLSTEMISAINRYISGSVMRLLTNHAHLFNGADSQPELMAKTIDVCYRLSKCSFLNAAGQDSVNGFLLAFTCELKPSLMIKSLRILAHDMPVLIEENSVGLSILASHFERCGKYYNSSGGWCTLGTASAEEKTLTMVLFTQLLGALSKGSYSKKLFSCALSCLFSSACSLSPDYVLSQPGQTISPAASLHRSLSTDFEDIYIPQPVNTVNVILTDELKHLIHSYACNKHDIWAHKQFTEGWSFGFESDEYDKKDSLLLPYNLLSQKDKYHLNKYMNDCLRTILASGWSITSHGDITKEELIPYRKSAVNTNVSQSPHGYCPAPLDVSSIELSAETENIAAFLADNAHQLKQFEALEASGKGAVILIPYHILPDEDKERYLSQTRDFLRYMKLFKFECTRADRCTSIFGDTLTQYFTTEKRFAFCLLQSIIGYTRPIEYELKQRKSPTDPVANTDFYAKVCIPLVQHYFEIHQSYFIATENQQQTVYGAATAREKKMVATLFYKLAMIARNDCNLFGSPAIVVDCIQVIVTVLDIGALIFHGFQDSVSNLQKLLLTAAEDLNNVVISYESKLMRYIFDVLLPILCSLFRQIFKYDVNGIFSYDKVKTACFGIINSLYRLGCNDKIRDQKHLADIGNCLNLISASFTMPFLELNHTTVNLSLFVRPISSDPFDIDVLAAESKHLSHHYNDINIGTNHGGNLAKSSNEQSHNDNIRLSLSESEISNSYALPTIDESPEIQSHSNLPHLNELLNMVDDYVYSNCGFKKSSYITDVILPMLCSYISHWICINGRNRYTNSTTTTDEGSKVNENYANFLLGHILRIINTNFVTHDIPTIYRIGDYALPLIKHCSASLLDTHFLPVTKKLTDFAIDLYRREDRLTKVADYDAQDEVDVMEDYIKLAQNVRTFYPMLIKLTDRHKQTWITGCNKTGEELFRYVADMFSCWHLSQNFRREEQIYNSSTMGKSNSDLITQLNESVFQTFQKVGRSRFTSYNLFQESSNGNQSNSSLVIVCVRKLLAVGLNFINLAQRQLMHEAKSKLIQKETDSDVLFYVINKVRKMGDESRWAKRIVTSSAALILGLSFDDVQKELALKIMEYSRVLHRLHIVDNPQKTITKSWKKILSQQRKRAIMKCFTRVPLYNLPKYRAVNVFIDVYRELWLSGEKCDGNALVETLTSIKVDEDNPLESDPLSQLVLTICRDASNHEGDFNADSELYKIYADIMSESCIKFSEEDDDDDVEDGSASTFEESERAKRRLDQQQSRLAERNAAQMVLILLTESNGVVSPTILSILRLGISLLRGGNQNVQEIMLKYLQSTRNVNFFTSLAKLTTSCSVLDLDTYERSAKAEILGLGFSDVAAGSAIHNIEFICSLFRFLQLLCEGHNLKFQDYLRTQAGNTTTVNIIVCTVDYLLRLQESISDFYWHYSSKEIIDIQGRENFSKAIRVAKQVFRTLTEYIQGPCVANQFTMSNSRLWDAVGGFWHVFACLQMKLSKETCHLELLRELLKLHSEMVIMLLSMLEGSNANSGSIAKQLMETIIDSSEYIEMILKFFNMFLKLNDLGSSKSFKEFDIDGDGWISPSEFQKAMEQHKIYSSTEIDYLLKCADTNHDGKLDYMEFTERFQRPAQEIGFNLAVLIANLTDHVPDDPRLAHLEDLISGIMTYFESSLGRIEILGPSQRIERVYFEIKTEHIDQWQKPQIQDSKRTFLRDVVTNGNADKEKLENFVGFCEDTIFEMQYGARISGTAKAEQIQRALEKRERDFDVPSPKPFLSSIRKKLSWKTIKNSVSPLAFLKLMLFCVILPISFSARFLMLLWIWINHTLNFSNLAKKDTKASRVEFIFPHLQKFKSLFSFTDVRKRSKAISFLLTHLANFTIKSFSNIMGSSSENVMIEFDWDNEEDGEGKHSYKPKIAAAKQTILSLFARSYYASRIIALLIAFGINIILLFCKVTPVTEKNETLSSLGNSIILDSSNNYLDLALIILPILHLLASIATLIAYWNLKVPLAIFKREKEIARKLEFDGYWVTKSRSQDYRDWWDGIVINCGSFPSMYWDKFIKRKVRDKYSEHDNDYHRITQILNIEDDENASEKGRIQKMAELLDLKYWIWRIGVICTDRNFIYLLFYLLFSLLGNCLNNFFFAVHLIDFGFGNKTLSTVLQSVTHHGRQLIMTLLMMAVVIYIYAVVAFNFFRQYYSREIRGRPEYKCDHMFTCFMFHLNSGLRSGGGIGDTIDPADGDLYEYERIAFDFTFFFFVIVILLAIVQGLIIDAFGELRDKQESVKEDLENKCFICGIGKEHFDKVPHGFDIHVEKEHNLANYMFFLLHLIEKPETEYTGQESYVWGLYQQRRWEFFPVGDCFRDQYQREQQLLVNNT
ncbi:uncharacterized protein TRIADDRAFT_52741 [Trichoplax adhaerens]|uniref:Ryanodine receptor 3 n=1 Tax=Trichoplax adhaerens TaxID=10228 RepID=B3RK74_TRIAD|nr:hypothetical protein TRIADDRAFT_52741 [Trichoplax adhaerens]EDV29875.1 hypothetical protein TRIADDRAFT_52741 [Trichoplax adhaerens]|eukprot:XP_002109077.1 hypothetical protein TRIADDRAFT_52741 [Trichoplax adhaerens]